MQHYWYKCLEVLTCAIIYLESEANAALLV